MSKVLYFEGVGMSYESEVSNVGNHRIRTAFKNNEGEEIYLELGGHDFADKKDKNENWISHINSLHYITNDKEDEDINRIKYDRSYVKESVKYTKEDLIEYINELCNTDFNTLEVLHDMEGYRVFADNNKYNLMENHVVNRARTEARIKAYNEIDMYFRKRLYSKYRVISLMNKNDDSITVRCHASKERLQSANMTDKDRERTIVVNY